MFKNGQPYLGTFNLTLSSPHPLITSPSHHLTLSSPHPPTQLPLGNYLPSGYSPRFFPTIALTLSHKSKTKHHE
ncbi:Uncharacterised protein [Myroides odoratus]|uniref:Uncharacterized protein n=1 Tax=Myroides odoratus TaxID=256 RepID=A0A378RID3_MYROD|nr:Uncharacterised protein [Myroides odoratus]